MNMSGAEPASYMSPTDALVRFARGDLSTTELQKELGSAVELRYLSSSQREIRVRPGSSLPVVLLTRDDVRRAIQRYLAFQWTEETLSDWAATIRLLDSSFEVAEPQRGGAGEPARQIILQPNGETIIKAFNVTSKTYEIIATIRPK